MTNTHLVRLESKKSTQSKDLLFIQYFYLGCSIDRWGEHLNVISVVWCARRQSNSSPWESLLNAIKANIEEPIVRTLWRH